MCLATQPRWLYIQYSYKFLFFLWIFTGCSNSVSGNPRVKAIVTKARCYANCLTKNPASNETEIPCQTNDCKECLGPCGSSDSDEAACKQTCRASSSCLESCEFLTLVKNFSSVTNGDNSSTPTPGTPSITNRSLTSISLKWEAVQNTTGSAVYMIEMEFSDSGGNSFWPVYLSEVFVIPEATISFPSLCAYVRSAPLRSVYSPVLFKFRVAVLTANSSLSVGQQTVETTLVKPAPVTNVTLDSLLYDPATVNKLDRIILTVSWIPPSDNKHLITKYAVMWELDPRRCNSRESFLDKNWETAGPDNNFSGNVYSRAKRCNHHLVEVRSMIGCSASDKATLIYTYPGCQNITNFPKSECYKFDPPEAPIEDRVVHNIRLSRSTTQDDYRFQVNMAWDPPVYPYKNVTEYIVWIWKGIKFIDVHRPADPSLLIKNLRPGTTYKIEVIPRFRDRLPSSKKRFINFTTPAVPRNEVKVQLKACNFYPSPEGGSFVVNISWNKPTFNYSSLTAYQLYYQVGSQQRLGNTTSQTHFLITGVMHGEQVTYSITPIYKHHEWITGTEALGEKKAPLPPDEEVKVRHILVGTFLRKEGKSTFSVNFTWTGPLFNFSLHAYEFTYELTGYSANEIVHGNVTKPELAMIGVRPKENVKLKVTPVFANRNIQRIESPVMVTAPEPDAATIRVRNLSEMILITSKPDQYNYFVSWEMPFFKESKVDEYVITCSLSGNPDRAERWQITTEDNNVTISDLIPGDRVEVEVISKFIARVITGKPEKIFIEPPKPSMEKLKVEKLGRGSFVEDEGTNTFNVTFTWRKPSFEHSNVHSYEVSYEFQGGFARDQLNCSSLVRTASGCLKTRMNQTSLKIEGVFPEEQISLKVKPLFDNEYIIGQENQIRATAPRPNEELVKVIGLKHGVQVAGPNNTFSTTVWWEKPLFKHSGVKYYTYKVLPISDKKRRKRDINLYAGVDTSDTNATISGIIKDIPVEFQVTPVFQVRAVNGINDQIDISWKDPDVQNDKGSFKFTPAQMGGLIGGVILGALIAVCLVIWCNKQRKIRMEKRGLVSGTNALIIDHWEVDSDLVSLEEEQGEGAFGKVYKGTIKQATTISRRLSVMPPVSPLRKSAITQAMPFTVAVKMLHGMADSDQRREFLEEIQLMKALGSHKNIVNMVGCCTLEEPMFLLVEFVPYGDLLHYLRKRRGKVKLYPGDESKSPYRSTYCETYVLNAKRGEISVQATRSDRIYVNTPDAPKSDGGNVQILSFSQSSKAGEESGAENKGMAKDEIHSDDDDEEEDALTPGDLLAFAWQISEGMEYLARKGFVHRDLAARNVLVGENKIAKVADFGLTRHVYEEKVYHAKRSRKLPLKWMSIEAIFDQTFTSQSDVWAFGVLLWELVTLGGTPYPTINNRELLRLLKTGYRMEKPEICNDEIYEIMTHCWMESPDDRPNFTQIRERLEVMMQKDNPYLDFSALDESREYYNVPSFNSLVDESTDDEFLDKEDDELLRGTSDDCNEGENIDAGDSAKRNELATMAKAFKNLDKRGDNFDPGFGLNNNNKLAGKGFSELKDIKVDFDAIEMSIYRAGNKEIAL